MAKSCCRYPESKGAATTKPLSHGARKFPHWSSVLGEFKPWDSGVTAIMAHHAPLPIGISIASSAQARSVLVARAPSVSFGLFFSLVASAFAHPLLRTPSTTVPSRADAPATVLLLSLSFSLSRSNFVYLPFRVRFHCWVVQPRSSASLSRQRSFSGPR